MIDFKCLPNEDRWNYLWRIGTQIENTKEMSWEEAAPFINQELEDDETKYLTSSAYRKPVQYTIPFYEHVFSKMQNGDEYLKLIQEQKDELYKLKRQAYDQRREYNKLKVVEARDDHLYEEIVRCAESLNKEKPLEFIQISPLGEKEALIVFADWHYGMVTDNIWNTYSVAVCKRRVAEVVSKAKEHIETHSPTKLHILLLGDAAHGAIHTTARVASEEDTCDQLMHVSELIAEAINELSKKVASTYVYSTYGNHLRTIQDKKNSSHSDNMEKIIPWWLGMRFKDRNDVFIINSEFEEFIKLNVCGYNICAVHGDLDNIKNLGVTVNTIFSKLYGETIDYTISADKHHLEEFERFDIENILVRSLCGTDDYANDHRLYSSAGQTLMIFTPEDGRYCTANIKVK